MRKRPPGRSGRLPGDPRENVPGSAAAVIAAERPALVVNAAAFTSVDGAEEDARIADRVNAKAAGEIAAAAAGVDAA